MKGIFVIIKVGYEGIDSLLYATTDPAEIPGKIREFKEKEVKEVLKLRKSLNREWKRMA